MSDPYARTWQDETRLWDRLAALGDAPGRVARLVYLEGLNGWPLAERFEGLLDRLADTNPEAAQVARLMYRCGAEDRAELAALERTP